MKYEFIKNGTDDWSLKYKDKEIKFHSTVGIAEKLQDIPRIARRKMLKDLAKDGMTIDDLIITSEVGSQTIENRANLDSYEKTYIDEANTEIFQEVCKELFNMSYEELVMDIGIDTNSEARKLGEDIGSVTRGQTPR